MMNPARREPIFNMPRVVIATIAVLVGIHSLRTFLPDDTDFRILLDGAFIPAQWLAAWDPSRIPGILAAAGRDAAGAEAAARLALADYVLRQADLRPWSWLSYGLLHGSWMHVGLNSVWLAAFGTPVARRCGPWRFLALACLATVAGAAAHLVYDPEGVAPLIGASAGVSGLMAAAACFVFAPGARVPGEVLHAPRQGFLDLVRNRQVVIFLGVWLITNALSGLTAVTLGVTDAAVAWDAHLGGFLAGLILFPLLDPVPRMLTPTQP